MFVCVRVCVCDESCGLGNNTQWKHKDREESKIKRKVGGGGNHSQKKKIDHTTRDCPTADPILPLCGEGSEERKVHNEE